MLNILKLRQATQRAIDLMYAAGAGDLCCRIMACVPLRHLLRDRRGKLPGHGVLLSGPASFVVGDITDPAVVESLHGLTFDLILSVAVLEHLDRRAVRGRCWRDDLRVVRFRDAVGSKCSE